MTLEAPHDAVVVDVSGSPDEVAARVLEGLSAR
jgi:hypothetical protein